MGYPVKWYAGRDSNPQPSEPESDALSIEPPVHLPYSPLIIATFPRFVKGNLEKSVFLLVIFRENSCFSRNYVL